MDEYPSKPVKLEKLKAALHKWLPAAAGALRLGEICAELGELHRRFAAEMAAVDATLHQHDAPRGCGAEKTKGGMA